MNMVTKITHGGVNSVKKVLDKIVVGPALSPGAA
jgi:hypothetical protein